MRDDVAPDGGRLYYEMIGGGTPLIFIHDGILHRETWDEQFAEFARWSEPALGRLSRINEL
jgi:hypothetical protein